MPIAAALIAASLSMQPAAPAFHHRRDISEVAHVAGSVDWLKLAGDSGFGEQPDVWVWLPPSYGEKAERRYPVLYMHDGQNLFDPKLTNYGKAWSIDEALVRLAGQGDLREWIVVGVRSPKARYTTLFPEKLYDLLPPERRATMTDEANRPVARTALMGDEYTRWLAMTLKPLIDREYRTLSGRDDTAIMGASMGALASLYAIGEYPGVFGSAAALSNPLVLGVYGDLDRKSDIEAVTEAWARWIDGTGLKAGGAHLIYSDTGMVGMDADFAPYLDAFDAMMAARGWSGADYQSRRFLGAEHDELYWHQRVDVPLAFLDRKDP